MNFKITTVFCLLAVSFSCVAVDNSFYQDRERGWFWHETYPEPVEEIPVKEEVAKAPDETPEPEPEPEEKKPIKLTTKWLKTNFPVILEMAMDDPTPSNLRRFHYVQRIMLDKAQAFAEMSREVTLFETALDENLLRPQNGATIYKHKVEARKVSNKVIATLSGEVGLFLFYDKKCAYCLDQAVLLKRLSNITGIEVLAVSLDGSALPNNVFPDFVVDTQNLREKYQIKTTPTVYIVKKDGSEYHNLVNGIVAINDIINRILIVAKRQDWIDDEQFASTQSTRSVLMTDDVDAEPTLFDEDRIMNEPDYLSERLKKVFDSKYENSSIPVYGYQGDDQ